MKTFFWLCILLSCKVQSQNLFNIYEYEKATFSQNYHINKIKVDSLINNAESLKLIDDAYNIAHDFSLVAYKAKELTDAHKYGELALNYKRKQKAYDRAYVASLFRTAFFFYKDKKYNKAINYYKEVISINLDIKKTAQAHCEIGLSFLALNDYYKSISYYKEGIKQLEELKEFKTLKREYFNLFTVYEELNIETNITERLNLLKNVKGLEKHINLTDRDQMKLDIGFSILYTKENILDLEKAKKYALKSLKKAELKKASDIICPNYLNLAKISNLSQSDSAKFFVQQALKFCDDTTNKSVALLQLSRFYKNKNDYISALDQIQNSLNILINLTDKSINDNIDLDDLTRSENLDQVLLTIREKIILLNKVNNYELALQHIKAADSLIDFMQNESTTTTKYHWRLKASELYTLGIDICYKLNDHKTAFYFLEKSKALLLTDAIITNNSLSELPSEVKEKQQFFENKLRVLDDDAEIITQYDRFKDSIKSIYPNYYKNQSLKKTITLDIVQHRLNTNSLILSYIWPNKNDLANQVYALSITKNTVTLNTIGDKNVISEKLLDYQSYLNKPLNTASDFNEFYDKSNDLRNILLPNNIKIYNSLTIIPDGILNNLPFETLVTDKKSKSYLINDLTISYAYSMSFLKHNSSINRDSKNDLLAIAPESFENLNLEPLKNSIYEIESIHDKIDGNVFTKNQATSSKFKEHSNNAKIIHLATHAEAGNNPWVAFSDKKMTLDELYNTRNDAELTVLSSCNSSLGEIAVGEGVMSLARGFFYSGSNSVVASLWNVNDKSTSILMEDFYKGLKAGETKSEALRNAKLKYLKSASLSDASPYYWSSFILLGNTDKIDLSFSFSLTHYFVLGLVILLILFIYLQFKKN